MSLVGFKPAILASEWSQTNTLDQAITGIGLKHMLLHNNYRYSDETETGLKPVNILGLIRL